MAPKRSTRELKETITMLFISLTHDNNDVLLTTMMFFAHDYDVLLYQFGGPCSSCDLSR